MLLSNTYKNYITEVIQLTRSIVIKSNQTINAINNYLSNSGDNLINLPQSQQKYFLNLAGIPYVSPEGSLHDNSDVNINIYSLDTNGIIPFTPESLQLNPLTLQDLLTYGTTYKNLLELYPTQKLLIKGVISPIPLSVSIPAKNYEIIGYDKSLIGIAETNLMPKLQQWISNYTMRWDNFMYSLSDQLYPAANLAILYSNMVTAIINIRLENCRTIYAHEFHIWAYIGSFFDLYKYKDIIPFEQAQFLYRNIDYIVQNSGTEGTLDFLNDKFANQFNLGLSIFNIRKELGNILTNINNNILTNLTPSIVVTQQPYGTEYNSFSSNATTDILTLVNKIQGLGQLNKINTNLDTTNLTELIITTDNVNIPTSVIQGDILKTTNVNLIDITSEKLNYFVYLAANNWINYKINISIPGENIIDVLLSPEDAIVLLLYTTEMYTNSLSLTSSPTTIPPVTVKEIMVNPFTLYTPLTESQLTSVIETAYLNSLGVDLYNTVLNAQIYPTSIFNLTDFNNFIDNVSNVKLLHWFIPRMQVNGLASGEAYSLIRMFYKDITYNLVSDSSYSAFLYRIKIDPTQFSITDMFSLMTSIYSGFFGISLATPVLQSPYSEMVDILETLTSYTLQWVKGTPTNNICVADFGFTIPQTLGLNINYSKNLSDPGIGTAIYSSYIQNIIYSANDSIDYIEIIDTLITNSVIQTNNTENFSSPTFAFSPIIVSVSDAFF